MTCSLIKIEPDLAPSPAGLSAASAGSPALHVPQPLDLDDDDNDLDLDDPDADNDNDDFYSAATKRKESVTLPLPAGSLPPRKRAKTKDEKEQRRIERIMRNRQAAHASREKKRRHVEELEKRCIELNTKNEELQSQVQLSKRTHIQMLEQHYLLMNKFQQLTSVLNMAKTTGSLQNVDLSSLTDVFTSSPILSDPTDAAASPRNTTATSPSPHDTIDSHINSPPAPSVTTPSMVSTVSFDSIMIKSENFNEENDLYSHSSNPSPTNLHNYSYNDSTSLLSPPELTSSSSSLSSSPLPSSPEISINQSHHPAVMVFIDLQRRLMDFYFTAIISVMTTIPYWLLRTSTMMKSSTTSLSTVPTTMIL
ncbi:hypothetical protein NADFUDRAFT_71048 [Nadsonia fulvescens var. elongata DSM 6958]|uniref:BZIP domain-containing protein n=1 Tax=Nadsonia fulvescens var. elongata DSM 6958 TaxID=857566 RepID=A0A1E3PGP6_9ASCO|nr:hypothetical protein NADFUDRAFT_71048 [Nadsonia fulvescens var. elongata DSM 6958]